MIATVTIGDGDDSATARPCIVRWTGAKRFLKIVAQGYCGRETDASVGVMQLPDKILGRGILCEACETAFKQYEASL